MSKAEDLKKQAEAKLKSFSLFGSASKTEEAIELYDKAAAQFKIAKDWAKAGECYEQAALLSLKLKNELESTEFFTQAASAYKKVDSTECMRIYKLVVEKQMEGNRFSTAAKTYKTLGELAEEEKDYKEAIDAYQKSADCYLAEDQTASANSSLQKVAHYCAITEDYKRAIEVFENIATTSLESSLSSWSCKDLYFKALCCHFAHFAKVKDETALSETSAAYEKYKDLYPAFEGTREEQLIGKLIEAAEEKDIEKWETAILKFDDISPLDDWKNGLLLKAKIHIRDQSGGLI